MRILINDANILIDLVKLNLLKEFSNLDFELFSTDFVVNELNLNQQELIFDLVDNNKFNIIETNLIADYKEIYYLNQKFNGLSFQDCSILYYSKKLQGILLTGDGKLRKIARNDNVQVRGIIFVFDELLSQNIINHNLAISKMKALVKLNVRLPEQEIHKKLKEWEDSK